MLFLIFPILSFALLVIDDLSIPCSFKGQWSTVQLKEDHDGRQPTQQPNLWTNMSFSIPYNATDLQLTANVSYYPPAYIEQYTIIGRLTFLRKSIVEVKRKVLVSVTRWGPPWTLYVGWKS